MVKIKNTKIDWLTRSLFTEYPFFLFTAAMLWQNTLFALSEWSFLGVTQYTFLTLFYSYILTVVVYLCHAKWFKVLMYAINILICFVNVYLRFRLSSNISPNVLQLALETNIQEATEFMDNYVWNTSTLWLLGLLLVTVMVIFFAERKRFDFVEIYYLKWQWKLLLPIVIILGGSVSFYAFTYMFKCKNVIELEQWIGIHRAKAMDNCSNIIYSFFDIYLCNIEVTTAVESTNMALKTHTICNVKDSLNVVLVVGESYIKWHASLYGYTQNTTPYMQEEYENGNLFVFQDVVSPYNLTSKTLRNVFSTNCNTLGESWSDYPFFSTLFRRAGYEVTFWDNQYDPVSREGFDFSLNSYLHNRTISAMTYSATNHQKQELDGELIDDFIDNDKSDKGHLFFSMFHLMGQHVAYYNRFPHGGRFDYFNADSIQRSDSYINQEKRQLIADYDNATRYNDYVLFSVLQHYRKKNSVVVYFSDHGEEVYDYQDFWGRNWKEPPSYDLLRYQFEVPFIIWCSDTYIKKNPDVIKQLKRAVSKPFMLDNVCHLLFHLGQIQTPYYHYERDILDERYVCPPRIVNDKYLVEDIRNNKDI